MYKKIVLATLLLTAVTLTGCIRFASPEPPAVAGVYKSYDFGNTWVPRHRFIHSGGVGSIAKSSILSLQFDPQDYQAVYAGTRQDGLLFTYDGGDSWQQSRGLRSGQLEGFAIDPNDKCILYAGVRNTVVKSNDCGREWREVYIDTVATKIITALALDPSNPVSVYAGNSAGDILKSDDGGSTWRIINRVNDKVERILLDLDDSSIVYVPTSRKGIFKSTDAGTTWGDVNTGLKPFSASLEYRHLIQVPDVENGLLLAAKYGILFTNDGGESWTPIQLITPVASADIYALAVNPTNSNEIYYATSSTFYKTVDGGVNWITKRLPAKATPGYLLADPTSPNVLYMGFTIPSN